MITEEHWDLPDNTECEKCLGFKRYHGAGGSQVACIFQPRIFRPRSPAEVSIASEDATKAAIKDWWLDNSNQAIDAVVPKAVEYGSTDLAELGRDLAIIMGRDSSDHEEMTELGIYVYMLGKFSRWRDAIKDGRRVSRDTIYDIKVYATMAERNRDVGGWPFPVENPEEQK